MISVLVVREMVMGDGGSYVCLKEERESLGFYFSFYYVRVGSGEPIRSMIVNLNHKSTNDLYTVATSHCQLNLE